MSLPCRTASLRICNINSLKGNGNVCVFVCAIKLLVPGSAVRLLLAAPNP